MASIEKTPKSTIRPSISTISSSTSTSLARSPLSAASSASSASSQAILPITPSPRPPRVQLIPYARTASYGVSLSEVERELLRQTSFDDLDLSSKDFDFEDVFTYDKPQKKLTPVVEVSSPTRERDWSNFSFSHYSAAVYARNKVNKARPGISEMYLKNQSNARKNLES